MRLTQGVFSVKMAAVQPYRTLATTAGSRELGTLILRAKCFIAIGKFEDARQELSNFVLPVAKRDSEEYREANALYYEAGGTFSPSTKPPIYQTNPEEAIRSPTITDEYTLYLAFKRLCSMDPEGPSKCVDIDKPVFHDIALLHLAEIGRAEHALPMIMELPEVSRFTDWRLVYIKERLRREYYAQLGEFDKLAELAGQDLCDDRIRALRVGGKSGCFRTDRGRFECICAYEKEVPPGGLTKLTMIIPPPDAESAYYCAMAKYAKTSAHRYDFYKKALKSSKSVIDTAIAIRAILLEILPEGLADTSYEANVNHKTYIGGVLAEKIAKRAGIPLVDRLKRILEDQVRFGPIRAIIHAAEVIDQEGTKNREAACYMAKNASRYQKYYRVGSVPWFSLSILAIWLS